MRALFALALIGLCLWGAAQLPDGPLACQTERGWTLSLKATLIGGAILIFLAGGVKRGSHSSSAALAVLAALVLFALDHLHIITPFGTCG